MRLEKKPSTALADVDQALATLDYAEMLAVSRMYQRWARDENGLSLNDRRRLLRLASDYRAIADYAGQDWTATDDGGRTDAVKFIARLELAKEDPGVE